MTDDFRLFSELLKSIKKRTIKIEEEKLYSNQCDSMTMRVKNGESTLTKVLYVFDLDVNLLFGRHFIKKNLIEDFNDDSLFMRNKQGVEVFRAFAQKDVYIIDKITSEFKKYALLASNTMFAIKFFKILFVSFAMSTIVNSNEILLDADIDFRNDIEIDFQSSNVDSNIDSNVDSNIDSNVDSNIDSNVDQKRRDLYEL